MKRMCRRPPLKYRRSRIQPRIWTKATPSICWSRNGGELKPLEKPKEYADEKFLCDKCLAHVSLRNMENHKSLRCQVCGHHHINLGQVHQCKMCVWKSCKDCNISGRAMGKRRFSFKSSRCGCGHYHKGGYICSDSGPSSRGKASINENDASPGEKNNCRSVASKSDEKKTVVEYIQRTQLSVQLPVPFPSCSSPIRPSPLSNSFEDNSTRVKESSNDISAHAMACRGTARSRTAPRSLRLPTSPYWGPDQLSSSTTPPPPGVSPPPPESRSRSCTPPPPGTSPVHWGTPSVSSVSPLSNGEVFGSSSPPPIAADLPTYNNWSMNSWENYTHFVRKPVSSQVSLPSRTFQVEERDSALPLPGVPLFLAHDLGLARESDLSATPDSISLSSLDETVCPRKSRRISDSLHSRPNYEKKTRTISSRKSLGASTNLKEKRKERTSGLGAVSQSLSADVPRDPRMRHTAVRETRKDRNLGGLKETQSGSKEVQSNLNAEQSSTKAAQNTSNATRSRLNAVSKMPEEIDRAIKSLLYDGQDQESETLENTYDHLAGEVYPMFYSKEKILPGPKEIVEENIIDNQSDDNSQEGAEDPHGGSCEEKLEKDPESKIKDMLAEVKRLSKMMEREKKKMRRLHQENERLDREIASIEEALK